MEIDNSALKGNLEFATLGIGKLFLYEGSTYMKTNVVGNVNAVCLDSSALCWFEKSCEVRPCNGKLILSP